MTVDEARAILVSGQGTQELLAQANATYYGWYAEQPSVQQAQAPQQQEQTPLGQQTYPADYTGAHFVDEYGNEQQAQAFASYLGGTAVLVSSGGPVGAPPMWYIDLPSGVRLNAALVADTYARNTQAMADAITAQNISSAGGAWTPPMARAPLANQPGTTPTTSTAIAPETHPGTIPQAQGTTPGPPTPQQEQANVEAQMRASIGRVTATPDEWGYAYRLITGSEAPAPEDLGYVRDINGALPGVTFDAWIIRVRGRTGEAVPATPRTFADSVQSYGLLFLVRVILYGSSVYEMR